MPDSENPSLLQETVPRERIGGAVRALHTISRISKYWSILEHIRNMHHVPGDGFPP